MTGNRLWIIYCFASGRGLQIEELRVPDAVKNGSETSVILDCDYSLLETDKTHGLVVKWYFNDNPTPVYQWIPNQKPQVFGVLRGKINLEYLASEEELKKHRALQINNPTPDLTGDYKCTVSTFFNETSQTKRMVIYVPEKSLEVTQTKQKDNSAVNVTCVAEGVFPEPSLAILREERADTEEEAQVQTTLKEDGVYDIIASILLDDKHLKSPTKFFCELRIPEANYTVKTSSIYYPDAASSRSLVTWLLLFPLLLCLRL
ncbi:uncharacterized protein [Anabrus simplex]|uniref:uncharacterized protein n=1 Tax=Anabrus simplex TaxID=316456 RepID=UPI0035A27A22